MKKPSSQIDPALEIRLSKSLGISSLTDLPNLLSMCLANSSQGLALHNPRRRLSRPVFSCLITTARSRRQPVDAVARDEQARANGLYKALPSPLEWLHKFTYVSDDRLLNCHHWPDCIYGSCLRCSRLHPCPAFRPASREESKGSAKLILILKIINSTNNEHTRPPRSSR